MLRPHRETVFNSTLDLVSARMHNRILTKVRKLCGLSFEFGRFTGVLELAGVFAVSAVCLVSELGVAFVPGLAAWTADSLSLLVRDG